MNEQAVVKPSKPTKSLESKSGKKHMPAPLVTVKSATSLLAKAAVTDSEPSHPHDDLASIDGDDVKGEVSDDGINGAMDVDGDEGVNKVYRFVNSHTKFDIQCV